MNELTAKAEDSDHDQFANESSDSLKIEVKIDEEPPVVENAEVITNEGDMTMMLPMGGEALLAPEDMKDDSEEIPSDVVAAPVAQPPPTTNSDGAPRRFKSAFIIFSSMRHKQIKKELLENGTAKKTTDIAKMVSHEWREMEPEAKSGWEAKSKIDKDRYEAEKARYKIQRPGRQGGKRILKDPDAPKRPMSAFLAFSNQRRADLKRKTPTASNADLSKMLSIQWKVLGPEAKAEYVEDEAKLRKKYKTDIATWRRRKAAENKANRKKEEAASVKALQEREVMDVMHRGPDGMMMQQGEHGGMGNPLMNQFGPSGSLSQFQAQALAGGRMGMFPGQDMRGLGMGGAGGGGGPDGLGGGGGNVFFSEQMARNAAAQQLLAQHLLAGQQFMPQQPFMGGMNQGQGIFSPYLQQQQQQPQGGAPGDQKEMNEMDRSGRMNEDSS